MANRTRSPGSTPETDEDGRRRGPGGGPGDAYAGAGWIGAAGVYLLAAMALLLYTLVMLWPQPTPDMSHSERERIVATRGGGGQPPEPAAEADTLAPGEAPEGEAEEAAAAAAPADTTHAEGDDERHPERIMPGPGVRGVPGFYRCVEPDSAMLWIVHEDDVLDPQCVSYFGGHYPISNEQRLLLIVLVAGALGALLHGLRSLRWYVGTRRLKLSWLPQYFIAPLVGALLALGIYAVLRGGFFAPSGDITVTSPISFAAAAFLVGLFNEEALAKLREIAASFFAPKPRGPERAPELDEDTDDGGEEGEPDAAAAAPSIAEASLKSSAVGVPADTLEIAGTGYTAATRVEVNGARRAPVLVDATRLTVPLTPEERAVLAGAGSLTVAVIDPGPPEARSAEVTVPPASGEGA